MIVVAVTSKQYKIQKLDEKPGIYFTKKFGFLLSTESWTIAIDTNLRDLEDKFDEISAIWKEAIKLKNDTVASTWTDARFQQTGDVLKNTQQKIKRLYEIIGTTSTTSNSRNKRTKRGLVNTVGYGLKTLFGTMDSDDAEYYNEKINTLDSNQHRVYQLEKDQLTVVRHTISDLTHTFRDFQTNQDVIIKTQNYLEQLQELNRNKTITVQNQINEHFKVIGALQIVELTCRDLDSFVTDLYLGIDAMRHSSLSTLLVNPDKLIKYLKNIKRSLKTGSTLPVPVTEETVHEYYELIKVTAWLVNDSVLRFFLSVPLKHVERTYNLFEVIPVPTRTPEAENTSVYAYVQPQMDFIAVSLDEQRYMSMTQRQVDACRGSSLKICPGPSVVNYMSGGQDTCETAYFRGMDPPTKICDIRLTYVATSIWTEITGSNQWMFVLPHEELITVTCPGTDGTHELEGSEWIQGTGLLMLPTKCQMIGSSFNIYSRVVYKNKVDLNVSSVIRIPKATPILVNLENNTYETIAKKLKNATAHVKFVSNSLNDLSAASIRLDKLDSILNQYEPNNYVSPITHGISITIVFVICVITIYYFKLYKICLLKRKSHAYLPVAIQSTNIVRNRETQNQQFSSIDLDDVPLEDRIKLTKRKESQKETST